MARIKLYFDVEDKEYFRRLEEYILANFSMYFEISDKKEAGPGTCIVSDYINKRNRKGVFLVKKEKGDISKFKSAFEICSVLLKMNSIGPCSTAFPGKRGPMIVCVTSASGGAGKTTIAKAMSCEFASKGRKVLYINPNPFSSSEPVFNEKEKNSYSRLRYYISKEDENIIGRIKSLASHDAQRRVDYIVNKIPSPDGFLNAREAAWMMEGIVNNCPYNTVVFDIPSYPGEGHIEIMKYSHRNFIVLPGPSDEKYNAYQTFIKSNGVGSIVEVNNFSNEGENPIPRVLDIFTARPLEFWNAIAGLCFLSEEKYENSN